MIVGPNGAVYTDWGTQFSDQLARSDDHGAAWQPLPGLGGQIDFYATRALAVDPAGVVYAALNGGGNASFYTDLSVSRDRGASWTLLFRGFGTQDLDLGVDPFSATTLFLHSGLPDVLPFGPLFQGHLSRSADGGASWTEIDQTIVADIGTQRSVTAFALDATTSGRLYAATALAEIVPGNPGPPRLSVSNDGGSTWPRAADVPGVFNTLVVDPSQPATIQGGGPSGIFRSGDGGQTFVSTSAVSTRQIVGDPLHAGRFYAATTANGVLASTDGGWTWSALNSGLTDLSINAVALDAAGGYLYAATSSGVFVYRFPDPGTLVLDAAHPFSVTLSATDQRTGRVGPGVATPMNDLWGWFSIPAITGNPNNPEVFVKMLDGTASNGSYWFFYGGLTDLAYTLTVTEDATGRQRTYTKPAGSECGGSDTAAFTP